MKQDNGPLTMIDVREFFLQLFQFALEKPIIRIRFLGQTCTGLLCMIQKVESLERSKIQKKRLANSLFFTVGFSVVEAIRVISIYKLRGGPDLIGIQLTDLEIR